MASRVEVDILRRLDRIERKLDHSAEASVKALEKARWAEKLGLAAVGAAGASFLDFLAGRR